MAAQDLTSFIVDRAALRSRLLRIPILGRVHERHTLERRERFSPAPLAPEAEAIITAVRDTGVCQFPGLHVIAGDRAEDVVEQLIAEGPATLASASEEAILESEHLVRQMPAAYYLGLEHDLLDLAEAYLGEPCFFLGCSAKQERVRPHQKGVRQWHLDIEDDRMLRLIIYLNDVGEGGGAFQFIDRTNTSKGRAELSYRSGFLRDEILEQAVGPSQWHEATGAVGSVVAFDGTSVFHRVMRPTTAPRFSISFSYASRHPRQILRPVRLMPSTRRALLASLDRRQRACIPAARWT